MRVLVCALVFVVKLVDEPGNDVHASFWSVDVTKLREGQGKREESIVKEYHE